ncbi:uncharacterized protein LOC126953878 isoform X4 [Macaca thibetana thibetana]|uniref:uncharacterized protein LOC126953878 isoform X4 n=1 Tax=Macaca thibetana thibetana TaxID=257877 RepID=UPI0021BCC131|nr:uncharacterized protein LOC126953878 isoform X4 [Macaca thibetana thibetana]
MTCALPALAFQGSTLILNRFWGFMCRFLTWVYCVMLRFGVQLISSPRGTDDSMMSKPSLLNENVLSSYCIPELPPQTRCLLECPGMSSLDSGALGKHESELNT